MWDTLRTCGIPEQGDIQIHVYVTLPYNAPGHFLVKITPPHLKLTSWEIPVNKAVKPLRKNIPADIPLRKNSLP